jgi:hypothetical protein
MKRIFGSRRYKYLARVTVFLITAALIAGMAGCVGDGSQNLEIQDWYDLDAVRNNLAGHHILMNDLDSTTDGYEELASPTANGGQGWQPIGNGDNKFTGSFDGQGYEIRDFNINRPEEAFVGLFGFVDDEGVIQDIGVVNATVNGQVFVGSLVGFTRGTVSNSYSTNNVTGEGTIGGLVGENYEGTVSNSYSTGSVSGATEVGGMVGENSGYVTNAHYNYDEVLINGENIITIGALFGEDFEEWLANGKFLDINDRLSQEDGYYVVNDITDFKQLLAFGQDDTLKFRSTNDMNLDTEPGFYIPYLAGEFDGNGHKISNLSFNCDFVSNVGLFGYLAPGGAVTGVGVENVHITGCNNVGGLVGRNIEGTISNSYSTGSVIGGGFVGGLVGMNHEGIVGDSYSTSNVTGDHRVGGLVGKNYKGTVSDSYSTSSVTGYNIVGGLLGINDGRLLGLPHGTVTKSYSSGSVTGNYDVGGLVGINGVGTISHSYSISSVTGDHNVGGLVGVNIHEGSWVSNSYSHGSVTGNSSVGGLVGLIFDGYVSNSYSTGNVTGESYVGGLIGENEGEYTIGYSYWDTQTSGQATSDGGTGKNTTEMKAITTFSDAEWEIIAVGDSGERNPAYIWNTVDDETYPFLSWQPIS